MPRRNQMSSRKRFFEEHHFGDEDQNTTDANTNITGTAADSANRTVRRRRRNTESARQSFFQNLGNKGTSRDNEIHAGATVNNHNVQAENVDTESHTKQSDSGVSQIMTQKKRVRENKSLAAAGNQVGQDNPSTAATISSQSSDANCPGKRTQRYNNVALVATESDGTSLPSMSAAILNGSNDTGETSSARGIDALNVEQSNIGQAFYQKRRKTKGIFSTYVDFGDMTNFCVDCHALFWLQESKCVLKNGSPVYTGCCLDGRIRLPLARPTPDFLERLLDPANRPKSVEFRNNIRSYNTMFAFTSMGANIDKTVLDGHGPYVFKISGQIYHLMGSPSNEDHYNED